MSNILNQIQWTEDARKSAPVALDADFFDIREVAKERTFEIQRAHGQYERLINSGEIDDAKEFFESKVKGVQSRLKSWKRPKDLTPKGFFLRASEPKFWTSRLQKELTAAQIQMARVTGLIGLGHADHDSRIKRSPYLPKYVIDRHIEQQGVMKDWLATTIIKCGSSVKTLAEVVEGAPERRACEIALFTRAQAKMNFKVSRKGHLTTFTLPPSFHAMREIKNGKKKFSKPNPRFEGKTTLEGIEWFRERWSLFRARMHKLCAGHGGYEYVGSVEPHTDATGHWHIPLYFHPDLFDRVQQLLEDVFVRNQSRNSKASDSELERGVLDHQIDIEPFRSDGGAEAYAVKLALYAVKNAESTDPKKIAEANFAKKLGVRSTFSSVQKKSIWRWLRAHREPDLLPEELRRAWHLAHGLSADDQELPRLERDMSRLGQIDISQRDYFEDGSCQTEDVIEYLESIAVKYRPVFAMSDFYTYEIKTADDYEQEQYIDVETGEVLSRLTNNGYEAMMDDWLAGDIYKNVERRLNKYGEPSKPNQAKPTCIARFDPDYVRKEDDAYDDSDAMGRWIIAKNPFFKKWERDEGESQALKAQKRQEQQKKILEKLQEIRKSAINSRQVTTELQLSIPGQGHAAHAENRASVGSSKDCINGDVSGFLAHMRNIQNKSIAAPGAPPNCINAVPG